MLYGLA
jgi:hypothetical protein